MPPRPREEEMALLSTQSSPPSFGRLTDEKALPTSQEALRSFAALDSSLTSALRSLSERSIGLLDEVDERTSRESLLVDACRGSLQTDVPCMVDDVQCLLEHTNGGPYSVTSCRASLAERQADSYLSVIEAALKTPERERVETELASLVHSISTQLDGEHKTNDGDASLRISSWRMPKLAFDMTVGSPVQYVVSRNVGASSMALTVEVRAIVEILAEDIVHGKARAVSASHQACIVNMERCTHEPRSFSDSSGTLGDGLIRVRLSPMEDGSMVHANGHSWRDSKTTDVGCLIVKEARVVQVNAVPPRPKTTVDLYVSSKHGERDATVTMRFQTSKTMNDEAPDLRIELLMSHD